MGEGTEKRYQVKNRQFVTLSFNGQRVTVVDQRVSESINSPSLNGSQFRWDRGDNDPVRGDNLVVSWFRYLLRKTEKRHNDLHTISFF